MRVENVWLFVSLLARNTTALVLPVGAFLPPCLPVPPSLRAAPHPLVWRVRVGGPPRTPHKGCDRIKPAPMGQRAWVASCCALPVGAGTKAPSADGCNLPLQGLAGELHPNPAPESRDLERREAIKPRGRQREGRGPYFWAI